EIERMALLQAKLTSIDEQLYEWGIPQALWSCARSRGMSAREFAEFWRHFVCTNMNRLNCHGKLVLTDSNRARLRGFLALRDAGWPSVHSRLRLDPRWVPVKPKSGKCLGWF